jgi:N-acetylmuramoyl-L-alanine amidase
MHKHPLKSAGFRVLKAPDVPSVLIEMGYLSNSAEEKLLNQPDYRRKLAEGVIRAADRFFRERPQAAR